MYEGKEKRMALIDELLTVAKVKQIQKKFFTIQLKNKKNYIK